MGLAVGECRRGEGESQGGSLRREERGRRREHRKRGTMGGGVGREEGEGRGNNEMGEVTGREGEGGRGVEPRGT